MVLRICPQEDNRHEMPRTAAIVQSSPMIIARCSLCKMAINHLLQVASRIPGLDTQSMGPRQRNSNSSNNNAKKPSSRLKSANIRALLICHNQVVVITALLFIFSYVFFICPHAAKLAPTLPPNCPRPGTFNRIV